MRAYCPVSFALKLAAFCLFLGVLVGAWVGNAVSEPDSQPSQPFRAPTTQAVDGPPGQPE